MSELAREARQHADAVAAAVNATVTREDHIRLAILWQEADRIARQLEGLTQAA